MCCFLVRIQGKQLDRQAERAADAVDCDACERDHLAADLDRARHNHAGHAKRNVVAVLAHNAKVVVVDAQSRNFLVCLAHSHHCAAPDLREHLEQHALDAHNAAAERLCALLFGRARGRSAFCVVVRIDAGLQLGHVLDLAEAPLAPRRALGLVQSAVDHHHNLKACVAVRLDEVCRDAAK